MGNPKARAFKKSQELAEAQHRARTQLRELSETPAFSGTRLAQTVYAPSFGDKYAWEIYTFEDSLHLYRSDLIFHEDRFKVRNHHEVELDSGILQDYLNRLYSLSLPMQPELREIGGLDGINFELALEGYLSSSIRVRWWSGGPDHWREVTNTVTEIIEYFRSLPLSAAPPLPTSGSIEA